MVRTSSLGNSDSPGDHFVSIRHKNFMAWARILMLRSYGPRKTVKATYRSKIGNSRATLSHQVLYVRFENSFINLYAPRESIVCAAHHSNTGYRIADGTSFAAPMVSPDIGLSADLTWIIQVGGFFACVASQRKFCNVTPCDFDWRDLVFNKATRQYEYSGGVHLMPSGIKKTPKQSSENDITGAITNEAQNVSVIRFS